MTRLCSAGRHDRAIGVARILHDEVGGLASSPRHPFRRQYRSRILSRCVRRARPERPLRSSVLRIKALRRGLHDDRNTAVQPALSAGNPSESSLPADVQPLPVDHVACTPVLDWVTTLWFIRHLTRSLPEPAAVEPIMAFGVVIAVTRSSEARIIGNSHVPKDLPKKSRRKISRGQRGRFRS
jgi:hypothetical protein